MGARLGAMLSVAIDYIGDLRHRASFPEAFMLISPSRFGRVCAQCRCHKRGGHGRTPRDPMAEYRQLDVGRRDGWVHRRVIVDLDVVSETHGSAGSECGQGSKTGP